MKKIFLLLAVVTWGCDAKKEAGEETSEKTAPAVKTAVVEEHTFHETVSSSGMLTSKSEIKLAFKTGGMIRKSYVSEGQHVKAGQLLAELDLSEIDAQVSQARTGYEKAKRDYERAETLFKEEAATRTTLNDAKSGLDIATQTLNTAEFNQKLSRIYAPVSGRILMKLAEQGELIGPFSPMFILGTGDQAYVVNVGLTDRDIVKISPGDKAEVSLDAYPGEIFRGRVTQIAQMITPSTGTYALEAEIAPDGKRLISGFVARVAIHTKKSATTLAVPVEALVNAHGNQADVYLYSGGKALKKQVNIGKVYGNYVAVASGLQTGESIITTGSGFVSDGDPVTVNNP
ncbi:MAG: efflux RND transporter periplasmic adaptor subunit [Leadbetterella sp.]|nr:efflux RND transporter periplasmic adaptor subunit [Leadbetterella sp.]